MVIVDGAPPFNPTGSSILSLQEAFEVFYERIKGRGNKVLVLSEGPSQQSEMWIKPKHNLFLSLSVAQKGSARHLSRDIEVLTTSKH